MRNILLTMIFYNLWWSQVVYSDFEKMQSNLSCKIFIAQNNKKYSSEIDGVIRYTTNKMEYCAFLGMPYALPPIKERRFEVLYSFDTLKKIVFLLIVITFPIVATSFAVARKYFRK